MKTTESNGLKSEPRRFNAEISLNIFNNQSVNKAKEIV